MVKAAEETEVDMTTDIVNQIIVDKRSWGSNDKKHDCRSIEV